VTIRHFISRAVSDDRDPVALRTFLGNGLQPGVELDDSAALRDLMETERLNPWGCWSRPH
jgi:hypothetical protein